MTDYSEIAVSFILPRTRVVFFEQNNTNSGLPRESNTFGVGEFGVEVGSAWVDSMVGVIELELFIPDDFLLIGGTGVDFEESSVKVLTLKLFPERGGNFRRLALLLLA